MKRVKVAAFAAVLMLALAGAAVAQREADPDSPRFRAAMALSEFLKSSGDHAVHNFAQTKMAPAVTGTYEETELIEMLRTTRAAFTGSTFEGAMPKGPYTVVMTFRAADGKPNRLTFEIEAQAPHRFLYLDY